MLTKVRWTNIQGYQGGTMPKLPDAVYHVPQVEERVVDMDGHVWLVTSVVWDYTNYTTHGEGGARVSMAPA